VVYFNVHNIKKLEFSMHVLWSQHKCLKCPLIGMNTYTETFVSLIYYVICHALLTPGIEHMLLQFISVMNLRLVQLLLHLSSNFVSSQVQNWTVGPQVW